MVIKTQIEFTRSLIEIIQNLTQNLEIIPKACEFEEVSSIKYVDIQRSHKGIQQYLELLRQYCNRLTSY